MKSVIAVLAIFLVLAMVQVEAYKSVRNRRILSEEDRMELHLENRAAKMKKKDPHMDDDILMAQHPHGDGSWEQEKPTRLYKSDKYHFKWGPEYPEHHVYGDMEEADEAEEIPEWNGNEDISEHMV